MTSRVRATSSSDGAEAMPWRSQIARFISLSSSGDHLAALPAMTAQNTSGGYT